MLASIRRNHGFKMNFNADRDPLKRPIWLFASKINNEVFTSMNIVNSLTVTKAATRENAHLGSAFCTGAARIESFMALRF